MIGVEVTGGVKKDRELAEEIVWFCLEKMLPRHRVLNITVLLTKTYEEGAKGFCYQTEDDRDFVIEQTLIDFAIAMRDTHGTEWWNGFTERISEVPHEV